MSDDEYDSESDTISVNSTDTLSQEDAINVNKIRNSIELYKEKLYNRIIPNDENGLSQTNAPEEEWKTIQSNDANILLNYASEPINNGSDCNIEYLSEEANKYLKTFFCNDINVNESINFKSIIRMALITFPNVMKVAHVFELNNSNQ